MGVGLKELLDLPEAARRELADCADQFRDEFKNKMGDLNRELQVLAVHAPREQHEALEAQRARLYEAFQKAVSRISQAGVEGEENNDGERVLAALNPVQAKASEIAAKAVSDREAWLKLEPEFNDVVEKIGELEAAQHDKAPALRKLSEAIQNHVNERKYQEAPQVLEQMAPKLEQIYREHLQQSAEAEKDEAAGLSQGEFDSLWQEFEELERLVEDAVQEVTQTSAT